MKLYLSVIGVSMLVISAVNIGFRTAPWYYIIALVVLCTALQFGLDGLIALLINKMPDRHFDADKPSYAVSAWEQKLYKKLKVRRWKDKVWELGGLGGFSKKNFKEPGDVAYVEKFIIECNKGVLTHRLSYPIGFLPMLLIPNVCAYTVALPVAVVNLFLNVLPTLALRYNTPKLQGVRRRLLRNKEKNSGEN